MNSNSPSTDWVLYNLPSGETLTVFLYGSNEAVDGMMTAGKWKKLIMNYFDDEYKYRDAPIPEDSIVYCDIRQIERYMSVFDYGVFCDWVNELPMPIIIHTHTSKKNRFKLLSRLHHVYIDASRKGFVEYLYVPEHHFSTVKTLLLAETNGRWRGVEE